MRIIAFITNSRLVAKIPEHFREQTSRAPPIMPQLVPAPRSATSMIWTPSRLKFLSIPLVPRSTIERGSESCALSDPVSKFREGSTAVEELFSESFVGIWQAVWGTVADYSWIKRSRFFLTANGRMVKPIKHRYPNQANRFSPAWVTSWTLRFCRSNSGTSGRRPCCFSKLWVPGYSGNSN